MIPAESTRRKNTLFGICFGIGFLALSAAVWGYLPHWDPPAYFEFADRRNWFGVQNAMDVLSNVAFLWVGGFWWKKLGVVPRDREDLGLSAHLPIYRFIAAASILTGLGSMWFHWNPNIETLFWDRLPMTLGFSAMIALIVSDRFAVSFGRKLAVGLAVLSVSHLILWDAGLSDLRPYILLQYGGILLAVTLAAVWWRWGVLSNSAIFAAILLYAFAKVFETKDLVVFEATDFVSGHTIKHLLAAAAIDRLFAAGGIYRPRASVRALPTDRSRT
jgi:hypothetical protein